MHATYRFAIRSITTANDTGFELLVGMPEEKDHELVPVNRTAFAQRLSLRAFHSSEAAVELELNALLEWLDARDGGSPQC